MALSAPLFLAILFILYDTAPTSATFVANSAALQIFPYAALTLVTISQATFKARSTNRRSVSNSPTSESRSR